MKQEKVKVREVSKLLLEMGLVGSLAEGVRLITQHAVTINVGKRRSAVLEKKHVDMGSGARYSARVDLNGNIMMKENVEIDVETLQVLMEATDSCMKRMENDMVAEVGQQERLGKYKRAINDSVVKLMSNQSKE
jgi:hypothetical protein